MKKQLLIQWVSRTFTEVIQPLIPKLSENFNIVIILLDYSSPLGLRNELNYLKERGFIEKYMITPEHKSILKYHLFMKSKLKELKNQNFDFFLTGDDVQTGSRYILDCALPSHCTSVCVWQNITYLFMYNQEYVSRILSGNEVLPPTSAREAPPAASRSHFQRIVSKIRCHRQILDLIKIPAKVGFILIQKKTRVFFDRYFLPWIIAGKFFRFGPYDKITQLSSGHSDALIFFDEREAKAHKKLLKTPKVYVAQYPTRGNCRCNTNIQDKLAILSPLSGFEGRNQISEKILFLFYRDFNTVLSQTNAKKIHLRLHPDETGNWPKQLQDYLAKHEIDASLVDSELPISKVMCDYIGMAGYASAALRDARASCDYAFIIGFAGVSAIQFKEPKQVFGDSEGIDWIEEDGTYDPKIFIKKKYNHPKRKSVPEIVMELSKLQNS